MTTYQDVGKHNNQPKKRKRGRPKCLKVNNAHQAIIPVLPKTTIQTNPIVVSTLPPQVVQIIDHTGNLVSLQQNKAMGHPNIINLSVPVTTVGSLLISGQNKDNVMGGMMMNSNQNVVTTTSANSIIIINKPANETLPTASINSANSVNTSDVSRCTTNSTGSSDEKHDQKSQTRRDKEVHNAEEKRRKAKINSWISKLGNLLSKFPTEKQNKTSILERAFEYINENEGKGPQIQCEPKMLLLRIKNLESVVIMLVDLLKRHSVPIPDNVQIIKVASKPNEINPCFNENNTEKKASINTCSPDSKLVLPSTKINTTSSILSSFPTDKMFVDQNTIELPVEKNLCTDNMVSSDVKCDVNMTSPVTSCSDQSNSTNNTCKKRVDLPVVLNSSAVKDIQHVAKLHAPSSTQLLQVSTINRTYGIVTQNIAIQPLPTVNASLLLQDNKKNITKLEDYLSVPLVYIPATSLLPTLKVNSGICQDVVSGKMEMKNSLWRPISSLIPPVCTSVKQGDSDISNIHFNVSESMSLNKVVEPCISSSLDSGNAKQLLLSECGKTIPSSSTNLSLSNDVMNQKTNLFVDINSSNKTLSNKVLSVESDLSISVSKLPFSPVVTTIASSTLTPTTASSSSSSSSSLSLSLSLSLSSSSSSLSSSPSSSSSSVISTVTSPLSSAILSPTVTSTIASPLVLSTIPISSLTSTFTSSMDSTCISNITTSNSDDMKFLQCSSDNLGVSSNQNDSVIGLNKSPTQILSESLFHETEGSNRNQSKFQDTDGLYRYQSKSVSKEKPQGVSGLNKSPRNLKNLKSLDSNGLSRISSKNLDMKSLENGGLNSKSSKITCNRRLSNKNSNNTGSSNKNRNINVSSNKNQSIASSTNDIPLQGFGIDNLLIISSTTSLNPIKSSKHSLPTDCVTHVESSDITEKVTSILSTPKSKYNSMNSKINKETCSPMKKGIANCVNSRSRLSSTGHTVASLLETPSSLSEFEVQIKRNVNPHYVSMWNDISSNTSSSLTSNTVGVMSCTSSNMSSNKNTCNTTSIKNLNNMESSNKNGTGIVSSNKNPSLVASTNKKLCNTTSTNKTPHIVASNKNQCTSSNKSSCTLTSTNDIPYSHVASTNRITCSNIVSPNKVSNSSSSNKIPFPNLTSSNSISSVNNGSSENAEKRCAVSSCEIVTTFAQPSSKNIKQGMSTATLTQPLNAISQHNSVKQVTSTISSANYSTKRWGNVLENAHNSDMLLSCFTLGNKKRQRNKNRNKNSKKIQINETPQISVASLNSPEQNITSFTSKSIHLNSMKSNQTNSVSGMNSQCSNIQSSSNSSIITSSPPAYSEAIALNMYSIPQSLNASTNKNCIVTSTNEIPYSYITSTNRTPQPLDASTTDCNWIIRSSVSLAQKPTSNNSAPVSNSDEILTKSCTNASNDTNVSNYSVNSSSSVSTTSVSSSYTAALRIKSTVVRTMKDRSIRNKWLEMEQGKNNEATSQTCTSNSLQVDQCASPVISFPNQGNRKRSMPGVSNEREGKRLAQCSIDIDENSSRIFSAESLCQSASHKEDEQKSFKTNVKISKILDTQDHITTQQKLEHPVQKLKHQPDIPYSNSLPTILNIFAPAPVPASTSNQSNLNTGISNFSAESLVNNECNVNMMGNNMSDSTFQDTMLMGANSQLFTNFSADTLLSDNESAAAYTEENIIAQNNANQMSQYWNNPWLSQEIPLNDSVFPNPSNMQNIIQRQQRNNLQASTECSPIKSIMSILQSTPNNNQNINFDNFNDSTMNNIMLPHAMITRFPHRNRRLDNNQMNTHTNLSVNTSQWNKNHTNNICQTSNKCFSSEPMMPIWNNHMANNHRPNNREQMQLNSMNISNMNTRMSYQNTGTKIDVRNKKENNGPMFGNYPLVSSGAS